MNAECRECRECRERQTPNAEQPTEACDSSHRRTRRSVQTVDLTRRSRGRRRKVDGYVRGEGEVGACIQRRGAAALALAEWRVAPSGVTGRESGQAPGDTRDAGGLAKVERRPGEHAVATLSHVIGQRAA